jgi:hypothetical protein
MQSWTDITHSVKSYASVRIPGLEGDEQDSKPKLICGEFPYPQEAYKSIVYVFNRLDGKLHTFNTFSSKAESGEEAWELVPESTLSIYDLK